MPRPSQVIQVLKENSPSSTSPFEQELASPFRPSETPIFMLKEEAEKFIGLSKAIQKEQVDLALKARELSLTQPQAESAGAWWKNQAEQYRIEERQGELKLFQELNPSLELEGRFVQQCVDHGRFEQGKKAFVALSKHLSFPSPLHDTALAADSLARVEQVVSQDWFQELPPTSRHEIVRAISTGKGRHVDFIERVVQHENFSLLELKQKDQLVSLFRELPRDALPALESLLKTKDHLHQKPLLLHVDFQGKTLLDNLSRQKDVFLHPKLEGSRSEYFTQLIQEIDLFSSAGQGNRGTCVASGVRHFLSFHYPAEYARIALELGSSEKGAVLSSGKALVVPPDALQKDNSGRTLPARLFDSSAMDFANGDDVYLNSVDKHYRKKENKLSQTGLKYEEAKRLLEGVFDVPFEQPLGLVYSKPEKKAELIEATCKAVTSLPYRAPQLVAIKMNEGTEIHSYHAFRLYSVSDGRAYLQNPWGKTNLPSGTELKDPPLRVENPEQGTYSMDLAEFSKRISWYLLPSKR